MKIIDCPQLSEEWWTARRGVPTASNFGRILTPAKMQYSKSAIEYIYELIAERVALVPPWLSTEGRPFRNTAMQNGVDCEPEARRFYAMELDVDVREVGICLTDDGRFGASPDGLIGKDGGLELKCPELKTHIKYLHEGILPPEYLFQVHGHLYVMDVDWVDFMSYHPALPRFLIRVHHNETTNALGLGLERFWSEYEDVLAAVMPVDTPAMA